MARPRRTASNTQAAEQAAESTQAPETTQEAAEVTAATESIQEPVVSTVTEIPAEAEATSVETPAEAAPTEAAPADASPEVAQSPEGAQANSDGSQAPEAEKVKTPDDLVAEFKVSLEQAVVSADKDTGAADEADSAQSLKAYRALPTTAKKQEVKAWMSDEMVAAMTADLIPRARTFMDILKIINQASSRGASSAPSKPSKTPTQEYTENRLALELSWHFLGAPQGMASDEFDAAYSGLKQEVGPQVTTYQAWFLNTDTENRGEEPDVHDVIKNAAKIATGKAGRKTTRRASGGSSSGGSSGSGSRGDVAKHIREFLDSVEANSEHPVAAIAKFKSTEYPDGNASPGAISARLFPKDRETNIEGVLPLADSSPKKVRKL